MKSSIIRTLILFLHERRRVQRSNSYTMKRFAHRVLFLLFVSCAATLGFFALTYHASNSKALRLAYDHPAKQRVRYAPTDRNTVSAAAAQAAVDAPNPNIPSFGHPIISGIQGVGFEQDLRLDPSNPNRLYTSAPGSLSRIRNSSA